MQKYDKISEIKKTIEQLERVYDLIQSKLNPFKPEQFSNDLRHMNGIQDRIEELLHECQTIELLNEINIKH